MGRDRPRRERAGSSARSGPVPGGPASRRCRQGTGRARPRRGGGERATPSPSSASKYGTPASTTNRSGGPSGSSTPHTGASVGAGVAGPAGGLITRRGHGGVGDEVRHPGRGRERPVRIVGRRPRRQRKQPIAIHAGLAEEVGEDRQRELVLELMVVGVGEDGDPDPELRQPPQVGEEPVPAAAVLEEIGGPSGSSGVGPRRARSPPARRLAAAGPSASRRATSGRARPDRRSSRRSAGSGGTGPGHAALV